MSKWHPIYGTKCGKASFPITPPTLGQVYLELTEQYGAVQLRKPVPGDTYRKMYKPLNEMDGPAFRNMEQYITVLSPARLYRSTAWWYKGLFHHHADCMWTFDYEYQFAGKTYRYNMAVQMLTLAYIPENLVPMDRSMTAPILDRTESMYTQLSLF